MRMEARSAIRAAPSAPRSPGCAATSAEEGDQKQSAEYRVVAALTQSTMPNLGTVKTVTGIEKPVVLGGVTISTSAGNPPTLSASGQMVQTGAAHGVGTRKGRLRGPEGARA